MQLVYNRAAEALDELRGKRGSLKYIIFNNNKSDTLTFRKRVYAVAVETLKHKAVLLPVIESSNLLQLEPQLSRNLALVLLHDFFFRKGIQCGGPIKYCIMRHKEDLRHLFRDITQKETRPSVDLPKYARVNLLKSDVSLVIAAFKEDGYLLCDERCGALEHNNFSIDPILPDVLKFHPLAPLTTHPLYRGSHIILQDKASCLPAYLLAPPPGSNVVDCCAAPGNKTTQLASIMRNKG
jgi:putative methyltransferase